MSQQNMSFKRGLNNMV